MKIQFTPMTVEQLIANQNLYLSEEKKALPYRTVKIVVEEGMMHVGIDKKNNFIMELGPREEFEVQARFYSEANLMLPVKARGRVVRFFLDGEELFVHDKNRKF